MESAFPVLRGGDIRNRGKVKRKAASGGNSKTHVPGIRVADKWGGGVEEVHVLKGDEMV